MNEKQFLSRLNSVVSTAETLQEMTRSIYSKITKCSTAEEALEMVGAILSDATRLNGLATLLLIDVDSLIKSGE